MACSKNDHLNFDSITIIVFGASGDLAKRKTFPALFNLYKYGFLPFCRIVGYARSEIPNSDFISRVTSEIKVNNEEKGSLDDFKSIISYHKGAYDVDKDYQALHQDLMNKERSYDKILRIFYLALPPEAFTSVSKGIKCNLMSVGSNQTRIVIEKPFGRDFDSYRALSHALASLFDENQLFRIDHYLGKEMIKNVIILRFGNIFFSSLWNRSNISNIQITFKERIGVEGRGSYFDHYGIIRDVMQNHLLQILSVIAMEQPKSLDSEHIRDEKVNVLKFIRSIELDHLILGQYVTSDDGSIKSYRDDPTVNSQSTIPTFAAALLFIDNDRWRDVPFFLKCGKALNEQKTEIRIQFHDIPNSLFSSYEIARNELVIRVSPSESVYLKLMLKEPGLEFKTVISELDLTYHSRYENIRIPDAYESLLLDILRNDHANFVRDDELEEAWRIFTPVLHQIERDHVMPEFYPAGTRGPKSTDALIRRYGYHRSEKAYIWSPPSHKL